MLNKYLLLNLFLLLIFIGCSDEPSDSDIIKAVEESLREKVPVSMAKHLTGGQNAEIEVVTILEFGKKREAGNIQYWPVKIYAKGTCTKMFGGREKFEGNAVYIIYEDDFGKLKAKPNRL